MLLFTSVAGSDSAPLSLILLVEDHTDTRQMYAEFLGATFDVVEAANGEEALRAVAARRPDVLITDLALPGMDGFELVSRLRGDPATDTMPVVCVSGYGGDADTERARQAGCTCVVQKPCLPDDLAQIVHQLLREGDDRSEG